MSYYEDTLERDSGTQDPSVRFQPQSLPNNMASLWASAYQMGKTITHGLTANHTSLDNLLCVSMAEYASTN